MSALLSQQPNRGGRYSDLAAAPTLWATFALAFVTMPS